MMRPDFFVVQIRQSDGSYLGTGTFVAPDKVLTCKHIIEPFSVDDIIVRWLGQERKTSSTILHKTHDAGLILISMPFSINPEVPNWSFNISEINGEVDIYGFNKPDVYELESLSRLTRGMAWQYGLFSLDQSVLPGFSGSPAFIDERLVGMVIASHDDRTLLLPFFHIRELLPEVGGQSVNQKEREVIAQVLTYLEDRRLLTGGIGDDDIGYESHFPDHLRVSAQAIRARVNSALQEIDRNSLVSPLLQRIQTAARNFQEETEGAMDGLHGGFSPIIPHRNIQDYLTCLETYRLNIATAIVEAAVMCGIAPNAQILNAVASAQRNIDRYSSGHSLTTPPAQNSPKEESRKIYFYNQSFFDSEGINGSIPTSVRLKQARDLIDILEPLSGMPPFDYFEGGQYIYQEGVIGRLINITESMQGDENQNFKLWLCGQIPTESKDNNFGDHGIAKRNLNIFMFEDDKRSTDNDLSIGQYKSIQSTINRINRALLPVDQIKHPSETLHQTLYINTQYYNKMSEIINSHNPDKITGEAHIQMEETFIEGTSAADLNISSPRNVSYIGTNENDSFIFLLPRSFHSDSYVAEVHKPVQNRSETCAVILKPDRRIDAKLTQNPTHTLYDLGASVGSARLVDVLYQVVLHDYERSLFIRNGLSTFLNYPLRAIPIIIADHPANILAAED